MIKEAIQYVVSLSKANIIEVDNRTYSDKELFKVKVPTPDPLKVSTLTSIAEYIRKNPDALDEGPFIVHISDYNRVELRLPFEKQFCARPSVIVAESNANKFAFGRQHDRETFNISLQTQFVREENAAALLQLIGTVSEENGVQTQDDGVSQRVTAKTGIASMSNVVIPNPLLLAPYRTFSDVVQPESLFVFRFHEGMKCALYEADGERWKADCIRHIREWFESEFRSEIASGEVVVLG